jgi:hypothetical protein
MRGFVRAFDSIGSRRARFSAMKHRHGFAAIQRFQHGFHTVTKVDDTGFHVSAAERNVYLQVCTPCGWNKLAPLAESKKKGAKRQGVAQMADAIA